MHRRRRRQSPSPAADGHPIHMTRISAEPVAMDTQIASVGNWRRSESGPLHIGVDNLLAAKAADNSADTKKCSQRKFEQTEAVVAARFSGKDDDDANNCAENHANSEGQQGATETEPRSEERHQLRIPKPDAFAPANQPVGPADEEDEAR